MFKLLFVLTLSFYEIFADICKTKTLKLKKLLLLEGFLSVSHISVVFFFQYIQSVLSFLILYL